MSDIFDPRAVAKKLSPASRAAVIRGGISDERTTTIRRLMAEMLFYREPSPMTTCYSLELTKFGHSVRDILQTSEK